MKYFLLAILLVLPVIVACSGDDDDDDDDTSATQTTEATTGPTETNAGTPIITSGPTEPAPTPTPLNVCPANPDPATPEQISIDNPEPHSQLASPLAITGSILAFEAAFNARILDGAGTAIVDNFSGMALEGQVLSPFSVAIDFTVTEETPACLEVFTHSARDNSVQDVYQIPVLLLP